MNNAEIYKAEKISPIVNSLGFISFKAFMFIFSICEHVSM